MQIGTIAGTASYLALKRSALWRTITISNKPLIFNLYEYTNQANERLANHKKEAELGENGTGQSGTIPLFITESDAQ
ncbi:hypothetical protein T11_4005 [Trichinella zimbabwensis]|uniref:Uncharacterized protein n=1 Tax=Trichinella zimbabwensis TaxID=268475 RepID=A0A0V1GTG6_9BILA|nr:hypothetical protein T11_4005 [Trichinella zimbabwensis]